MMLRDSAGRQRMRWFSRTLLHLCGIVAGVVLTLIGAALSVMSAVLLLFGRKTPHGGVDLGQIMAFVIVGMIGLPLLYYGVKMIRDTVRSQRDRSLDGVDLDKQPWMAKPEWRHRRVVHSGLVRDPMFFMFVLGLPLVFLVGIGAALTIPTETLVTAVLIAGLIVLLLGYIFRYLRNKQVEITIQNGWVILLLPVVIGTLGTSGQFAPATGRVLEVASGALLVLLFAVVFGYLYLRERRFGISICHLKSLPAYIGATLDVEIEIQFPRVKTGLPELPQGPIEIQLENVVVGTRAATVNWMTKIAIPAHAATRPGDGTLRIPITVGIPREAIEKIGGRLASSGWILRVRAPFRGVDYASWFGVPVYLPESEP